jgi:hypothetical protein
VLTPYDMRSTALLSPCCLQVLHFQARSYQVASFLSYFSGFWSTYKSLPWALVFDG